MIVEMDIFRGDESNGVYITITTKTAEDYAKILSITEGEFCKVNVHIQEEEVNEW